MEVVEMPTFETLDAWWSYPGRYGLVSLRVDACLPRMTVGNTLSNVQRDLDRKVRCRGKILAHGIDGLFLRAARSARRNGLHEEIGGSST